MRTFDVTLRITVDDQVADPSHWDWHDLLDLALEESAVVLASKLVEEGSAP